MIEVSKRGLGGDGIALRHETILIVDDIDVVRTVVNVVLTMAGFTTLQAATADEALELSRQAEKIDLVLCDIILQGISGPDLCQTLQRERTDLRVLLMSAVPSGDFLLLEKGWSFVDKPFLPKRLIEIIERVLSSPLHTVILNGWQKSVR